MVSSDSDDEYIIMRRGPRVNDDAEEEEEEEEGDGADGKSTDGQQDRQLDADVRDLLAIFPDAQLEFLRRVLRGLGMQSGRVAVVSNLLLETGNYPRESRELSVVRTKSHPQSPENKRSSEDLSSDMLFICSIFSDVEPSFVFEMLRGLTNQTSDVRRNLVSQNLLTRPYPKVNDKVAQKDSEEEKKKRALSEACVFQKHSFEQQKTEYYDATRVQAMDSPYAVHVLAKLQNMFPKTPVAFLRKTMEEHGCRLTLTVRKLEEIHAPEVKKLPYKALKSTRPECAMPAEPHIPFYKELTFVINEPALTRELAEKAKRREQDLESARAAGTLVECGCCFEEENLSSEVEHCDSGHVFCVSCVRRAAEDVIGKGRLEFKCLASNITPACQAVFALRVMEKVLLPAVYSGYLVRLQQDELKRSGIDDLAMCPFCDFAIIMPNKQDRVLKCLNPSCMRASCRLCREPSHIPLRCDEVEKSDEKNLRIHIENKMTAALLRTCEKCERKFFKVEGCNHMTCTCGAEMCYVCGEVLKKGKWNQHFASSEFPDRCPMYFKDTTVADAKLVEKAALSAIEEYKKEHPEAKDIELKYDPTGGAIKRKKPAVEKKPKRRRR